MIANTALALSNALEALRPRDTMVSVSGPNGTLYIVPQDGELVVADAGTPAGHLDDGVAEVLCGEFRCEWSTGNPRSWITRLVEPHESPALAVSDVEAARDALTMAGLACDVASGDPEVTTNER